MKSFKNTALVVLRQNRLCVTGLYASGVLSNAANFYPFGSPTHTHTFMFFIITICFVNLLKVITHSEFTKVIAKCNSISDHWFPNSNLYRSPGPGVEREGVKAQCKVLLLWVDSDVCRASSGAPVVSQDWEVCQALIDYLTWESEDKAREGVWKGCNR